MMIDNRTTTQELARNVVAAGAMIALIVAGTFFVMWVL
jgi:hypothetical protein